MMLGELKGSFPFGVVLVKDESSRETLPDWRSKDQQITTARTAMVIKIQHEVDGPASIRVWDRDQPPNGGIELATMALVSASGSLQISTAGGEHSIRVQVPVGLLKVRVIVSETDHPAQIDLIVSPGTSRALDVE